VFSHVLAVRMGQPAACVATILCYELHSRDYWSYLIIIIDVCSIILRSELFCRGCWSYLIIIIYVCTLCSGFTLWFCSLCTISISLLNFSVHLLWSLPFFYCVHDVGLLQRLNFTYNRYHFQEHVVHAVIGNSRTRLSLDGVMADVTESAISWDVLLTLFFLSGSSHF